MPCSIACFLCRCSHIPIKIHHNTTFSILTPKLRLNIARNDNKFLPECGPRNLNLKIPFEPIRTPPKFFLLRHEISSLLPPLQLRHFSELSSDLHLTEGRTGYLVSLNFSIRFRNKIISCVISRFRREVDENWSLLGYYAASIGNFLQTYRENPSVPCDRWVFPLSNSQEECTSPVLS